LPKLTGETAKAPNGEDAWSCRDAERVSLDDTLRTRKVKILEGVEDYRYYGPSI
jgi:nuclear transport factor 2 (NTF2) superfamily protein